MSGSDYFSWSYADQKFSESVDILARSFCANWQRMASAVTPLLILQEKDFPDRKLYVRTRAVVRAATKRGPLDLNGRQYQGSLEHTLRRSKRVTFERLAREILLIHEQINLLRGDPPH